MFNCASLCCILIHKFQCMYALSTYLPNFGCHFLPLWKIFQFTWTALRATARINFVHNLLFSLFIFPFLFSFFREFCACCPVWHVKAKTYIFIHRAETTISADKQIMFICSFKVKRSTDWCKIAIAPLQLPSEKLWVVGSMFRISM